MVEPITWVPSAALTMPVATAAPEPLLEPPGVYHGPFKSDRGCLLYEFHYYDESKK